MAGLTNFTHLKNFFLTLIIMVYYRRRRRYRPRRRPRRRRSMWTIARKAAVGVLKARSEKKHVDTNITQGFMESNLVTADSTYCLTSVSQGDTDETRNGDNIYLNGLSGSFTNYFSTTTSANTSGVYRNIIWQWYPDDAVPTPSLVVESTSGAQVVNSHYDVDNKKAFRILYDKCWTQDDNKHQVKFNYSIPGHRIPMRKIQYEDGTGVANGHIYMSFFSNTTSDAVSFYGQNRTSFYDS